jgi:hypothetical protein
MNMESYIKMSLKEYEQMKVTIIEQNKTIESLKKGESVFLTDGWLNSPCVLNPTQEIKDLIESNKTLKERYQQLLTKRLPMISFSRTVNDLI